MMISQQLLIGQMSLHLHNYGPTLAISIFSIQNHVNNKIEEASWILTQSVRSMTKALNLKPCGIKTSE